jgi:hypothetical protein
MKKSATDTRADNGARPARRVLAVLECRQTDAAVCARAVELACESGGYLTLVAVVPRPFPCLFAGWHCVPRVSPEELREQATSELAEAVALIPSDIVLMAAVDEGRAVDVIRRRVEVAAHDVVVVRRHRQGRRFAQLVPVPVMAC